MNQFYIIIGIPLLVTVAFLTHTIQSPESFRRPAQVTHQARPKKIKFDLESRELNWIKPTKVIKSFVFADYLMEEKYREFLNYYGLADTFPRRTRFSLLPLEPFSLTEINFLEKIRTSNSPVIKNNRYKTPTHPRAAAPTPQPEVTYRKFPITRGKPDWVSAYSWQSSDVATVLDNEGIPFNDVILYFKQFGFRDLKTGRMLSSYDLEIRYKERGSRGEDYIQLTPEDIESIKGFSKLAGVARNEMLVGLIQRGLDVADFEEILLANGFTKAEIDEAKQINNPKFKEAYIKGQEFNKVVDGYSKTEPPSIARLLAERDFGFIDGDDFKNKFDQESAAVANYKKDTINGWKTLFSVVSDNILYNAAFINSMGGATIPIIIDSREDYVKASLQEVVSQYGTATIYFEHQKEIEEKYRFRPLARPLEFATNFAKAIPNLAAKLLKYVDILREVSPIPLTGEDIYRKMTGQKFVAQDGYFYQGGQAITDFIEYLKPTNPDFHGEFMVEVAPRLLGQMVVQMGAGFLSGGTLIPVTIAVTAGGTSSYDNSKEQHAAESQRKISFMIGSMIGLLDIMPMKGLLQTFNQVEKQMFYQNFISTIHSTIAKQVNEEVAIHVTRGVLAREAAFYGLKRLVTKPISQEALLYGSEKLEAKLSYDPERKVLFIAKEDLADFEASELKDVFNENFEISLVPADEALDDSVRTEVSKVTSLLPKINNAKK